MPLRADAPEFAPAALLSKIKRKQGRGLVDLTGDRLIQHLADGTLPPPLLPPPTLGRPDNLSAGALFCPYCIGAHPCAFHGTAATPMPHREPQFNDHEASIASPSHDVQQNRHLHGLGAQQLRPLNLTASRPSLPPPPMGPPPPPPASVCRLPKTPLDILCTKLGRVVAQPEVDDASTDVCGSENRCAESDESDDASVTRAGRITRGNGMSEH